MGIKRFPQLNLTSDGISLDTTSSGASQALVNLVVRQELSLPGQCELTFSNPPGPKDLITGITVGNNLRVALAGSAEPLFDGEVTAIEFAYLPSGQQEIRVRAYDRSYALRKRQEARVLVQLTTRELAQEMAANVGLVAEGAETGPLHPSLFQHTQSDYHLLVSQLEQAGLFYIVRDKYLYLMTLEGLNRQPIDLDLGKNLLEVSGEVNSAYTASAVEICGWSSNKVEAYTSRCDQARSGRQTSVSIAVAEASAPETRLFMERAATASSIETLSQAELDRRYAQAVTVWGVAEGDMGLFPGVPVMIRGVAETIAGRHVLTRVTHTLDPKLGHISEFSSFLPESRARQTGVSASFGIVIDVDDPDKAGRVRVSLPAFGDVETNWLHVIAPAAGKQKGLVMLPDAGDRVLILFMDHESGQAVVIGGFYAPDPPYDPGIDGTAVRRYSLRTPDGHMLRMDDAGRKLRLEDSHGSYIEMSPDKVRVYAKTDLDISAPGQKIRIQGKAIDFDRA
jgi:phage baseplate assembly protein gpV/phage protein D